jgi:hypothetical protein
MEHIHYRLKVITARMIAPILRMTGFRFSKDYRHGATAYHRAVYAIVSTPTANLLAEGIQINTGRRQ